MMTINLNPDIEVRVLDRRLEAWGLPQYQSDMAAAVDLHACLDEVLVLASGSPAQLVPSGIAIHIGSPNIAAVILPRSGLGHKKGLVLGNLQGLIDADFQGQIMISVWNRNPLGREAVVIRPGERIVQMMFVPIIRPTFRTVDQFSRGTARDIGGFGSTGSTG
jgi:dUTP pyrophosphatase